MKKPWLKNPVAKVIWVPLDQVQANDYNPNAVAPNEMRLLHHSISHDGYTQPVVTIYDDELDKYVIVDGFHRYSIMRQFADIREANEGMLPIVVLDKPINDRMASTIRHNRARGKHSVTGMGSMVMSLLENGWTEAEVCNELGLEVEEIIRLTHVEGFSKLMEDRDYKQAWTTARMEKLKRDYERTGKCGDAVDEDGPPVEPAAVLEKSTEEC